MHRRSQNVARYPDHDNSIFRLSCSCLCEFVHFVSSNSRAHYQIHCPLNTTPEACMIHAHLSSPRAVSHPPLAVGVGVHRTRLRSLSALCPVPQPDIRPIASALLVAAVPIVVLSNNLFPAGVKLPGASALRGVQLGGPIEPNFEEPPRAGVRPMSGVVPPSRTAFARRLFEACADNL
jgi:hypothetical protein